MYLGGDYVLIFRIMLIRYYIPCPTPHLVYAVTYLLILLKVVLACFSSQGGLLLLVQFFGILFVQFVT